MTLLLNSNFPVYPIPLSPQFQSILPQFYCLERHVTDAQLEASHLQIECFQIASDFAGGIEVDSASRCDCLIAFDGGGGSDINLVFLGSRNRWYQ